MKSVAKQLSRYSRANKVSANGFTLIELTVVAAIIGALTAVGAPQLLSALDSGKDAAAKSDVSAAAKTCSMDLINGSSGYSASDYPLLDTGSNTCAASSTLAATSDSSAGTTFSIDLDAGGIPGSIY